MREKASGVASPYMLRLGRSAGGALARGSARAIDEPVGSRHPWGRGAVEHVASTLPFHRAVPSGAPSPAELRAALLATLPRPAGVDPPQGAARADARLRGLAARLRPRLHSRDRRDGRRRGAAVRALAVHPA